MKKPWPEHLGGLLPPEKVLKGQYEITGFLGEGGFGAVFSGVQHPLERPVAVKVMFPGHSARVRERFLLEAQAAAGLSHPNVVTIFDYGLIDQRRPFIVMELLSGKTLATELQEKGAMDGARALALIMPCLEALCEAHEQGLVHRDIKPENLFLTSLPRGREVLRLLDFGIARMTDVSPGDGPKTPVAAPRLTPTGHKVGTPHYLSPEYFERGIVKPALDVYSTGLVLAEMLSGRPVVVAENIYGYIMQHIKGQLVFADQLEHNPIISILRKATAKDLDVRYKDAAGFLEDLEGLSLHENLPVQIHSGASPADDPDLFGPTRPIPDDCVYIRPQRFIMGSGPREPGRSQDEAQRSVTLSRGFLIKKVPVTQGQWQEVMGGNPSHFKGEKNPVEGVNFFDALAFCNALSREHGLESCYELVDPTGAVGSGFNCKKVVFKGFDTDGYRLPTEAEWEFAARAGVAAARQGVLNEVGWYANNSRRKTHPVASKQPNAWGLYDTLGNVWEWVWDRYDPSPPNAEINPIGPTIGAERVQRGGCYSSEAKLCRLSNRGHSPAHRSFKSVGFRIVRTYN